MICRFDVVLPFRIAVVNRDALTPVEFARGADSVRIYPPFRARKVYLPEKRELVALAEPDTSQSEDDTRRVSGRAAVQADLLRIDLVRPHFDRQLTGDKASCDSLKETLFQIANEFLVSLRALTGSSLIVPISGASATRIEYLDDHQRELPPKEGLCRWELTATVILDFTPLDSQLWNELHSLLPGYKPPVYETLILDAHASRGEVGTSVVLLATALEILVDIALNHCIVEASLPEGLWDWINDRSGDYRKQPSVEEQWHLLGIFTGRFLKKNSKLWLEYSRIKKARNSYVHTGRIEVDGRPLAPGDIATMINVANEIVDFVKPLLPPGQQSRRVNGRYELSRRVIDSIYPTAAPQQSG